jgi:hypothetical protein
MRRFAGIVLLLLLIPPALRAGDVPEAVLPGTTQVYLRWDGLAAHRPAYAKTALGQTLQGDTGTFLSGLLKQTQEVFSGVLSVEQLLGGVPPEDLQKLQANATEAAKLLPEVGERGFLVAGELTSINPPLGRAFLVFPGGGVKPGPLFGAVRLGVGIAKLPVTESKVANRAVNRSEIGPLHLAWWVEGADAIVYLGTDTPEAIIKDMADAGKVKLTSNALFRRVVDFKKFETSARAFVDLPAVAKLAAKDKKVGKLLEDLGVTDAGALVLYSGFDGEADRSLTEWDLPGSRKGLLQLIGGKPFRMADVPPLPPDVVAWSMTNFDAAVFYDVGLRAVEEVVALASPEDVEQVKSFSKLMKDTLGLDLRNDLLGALGDKVVFYSTWSEGPLVLGETLLVKVKDGKKLQAALDQAVKALLKLTGNDASLRKRTYRGAEVREIHVRKQGFIFVPSYTIHDGWLAVSLFPQALHGYIGRAGGRLERWQPSERVRALLGQMPSDVVSVSYSDPRPALRLLLSFAPLVGGALRSFNAEIAFEVDSIPNAQETTRLLFPNVSVTTDDGKTLRIQTLASLSLPFDSGGLEIYGPLLALSFVRLIESLE